MMKEDLLRTEAKELLENGTEEEFMKKISELGELLLDKRGLFPKKMVDK